MSVIISVSPQRPSDVVTEVAATSPQEVEKAAVAAREAARSWSDAPAAARAGALAAAAAALAARSQEAAVLIVREVGKPLSDALGEVARSVAILQYYAQLSYAPRGEVLPPSGAGLLFTERRPHGVAGLITPWNFPLAIPLWKAAPALAAGNGVLLKPSPDATATAVWLGELFTGIFPDGLVRILPGGGETGAAVVDTADVVSFTGSAAVGRAIVAAAAARGVPVQAEMGGQNAALVLPDADPATAAGQIASAAMVFAGQKCTATRRVIVIGRPARRAEVTDALLAAVAALPPGDPSRADVQVGPVIASDARQRVLDAAAAARAQGGVVLHGGTAPDGGDLDPRGWYVVPTLLAGIDPSHPIAQEETFGPLAVIQPAEDLAEALRLAEGVRYGLVTSIHGRDLGQLLTAARAVQTGLVKINAPTTGVDFWAPFGGERDSSYGQREQGITALDFYTSVRTITLAPHP